MRASSVRSHHSSVGLARREAAAQHDALRFEQQQRGVRVGGCDAERIGQRGGGDRTGHRDTARAGSRRSRRSRVHDFAQPRRRRLQRRRDDEVRMDRAQLGQPLGRDDDPATGRRPSDASRARAPRAGQLGEQLRPRRLPARRRVRNPAVSSASCSSSASRGSGRSSSRTRAMASASSAPRSPADAGSVARRDCTAWLRRSSSGASSRNA